MVSRDALLGEEPPGSESHESGWWALVEEARDYNWDAAGKGFYGGKWGNGKVLVLHMGGDYKGVCLINVH